jgi:hypothetical protein
MLPIMNRNRQRCMVNSAWLEAPNYMELLGPSYRVMIKECGGGGDCLFYSIASGLNINNIMQENGL